jgi:ribosomal 30S subunit maturation factor RimM
MRRAGAVSPPAGYVRVGRLGRSFKLDGGVRLLVEAPLEDDELAAILDGAPKMFVPGLGPTRLRRAEERSGALVVHLEGVRDRETARALVNAEVWVDPAGLPLDLAGRVAEPTMEEELEGLPVLLDGARVGVVTAAFLDIANPYVEVALDAGGAALVPLVAPYVSLTAEALELLDPPAGLLE